MRNYEHAKDKVSEFQSRVYEAVKKIPKGKVSTYSVVARAVGRPRAFRAVGSALNKNSYTCLAEAPKDLEQRQAAVPCHRVVKSDGRVGGFAGGARKKIKMLKKESIKTEKDKIINFKRFLHRL